MKTVHLIRTVVNTPARRALAALIPVLIAVSVLWLSGLLPRWVGLQTDTPAPLDITFLPGAPGSASWASSYEDFGELSNLSDLVVLGVAGPIVEITPADWGHSPFAEVFYVKTAFKIDTVLKGNAGREITLTHTVIKTAQGWQEFLAEDPPPRPGERWVFFLRSGSNGYSEPGPWGRFKIVDDQVYSMNRVLHDNSSYRAAGLDFDGLTLPAFLGQLKETLDSAVITFADNHNLPCNGARFNAGVYQEVNVDLSTGTYGPDELTYTVKRVPGKDSPVQMPLPEGLTLKIDRDRISVYPHSQYRSTLRIETTPDLASGTYWVCVEYRLGDSVCGSRTIMVNVMGS